MVSAPRKHTKPPGKLQNTPIRVNGFPASRGSSCWTPLCQAVQSPLKYSTHQDSLPRPSQESSSGPLRGRLGQVSPSSQQVFPPTSTSQYWWPSLKPCWLTTFRVVLKRDSLSGTSCQVSVQVAESPLGEMISLGWAVSASRTTSAASVCERHQKTLLLHVV